MTTFAGLAMRGQWGRQGGKHEGNRDIRLSGGRTSGEQNIRELVNWGMDPRQRTKEAAVEDRGNKGLQKSSLSSIIHRSYLFGERVDK